MSKTAEKPYPLGPHIPILGSTPPPRGVSGDDSAKKGTQLSLNESYSNKETEKQLRSWYDQFISSKCVAVN